MRITKLSSILLFKACDFLRDIIVISDGNNKWTVRCLMVVTEPRQITSPSLIWALGQHQPIGARHISRVTNQSAAQGPADTSSGGFVTVAEDWHQGLWHGSYLSLSICRWEADASRPIRRLRMANEPMWSLRSSLAIAPFSPATHHLAPSRTVREPINHILTSNISSIRRGRNYPARERFEEFVCMFIPNKSLGSAQGALLDCKWAVMIISTSETVPSGANLIISVVFPSS